jgi:hypothetical protein
MLVVMYLFFLGRLNFISPWIVGFDKIETEKSVIYYHSGDIKIRNFPNFDSMIVMVEDFHNLKFKRKVQIVISSNFKEHHRFNWHNAMFISQPFGGRIYILYSEEYFCTKTFALKSCIQHELSHSIIYQNISHSNLIGYPLWFLEGIATYSSGMLGHNGYLPLDSVRERILKGNVIIPSDWGNFGFSIKGIAVTTFQLSDIKYAYSEFAYIVDDLKNKYGESELIRLLQISLKDQKFGNAFKLVYKIEFNDYFNTLINNVNTITNYGTRQSSNGNKDNT